jgi:tetratricopeptide (TPR) repeat protein
MSFPSSSLGTIFSGRCCASPLYGGTGVLLVQIWGRSVSGNREKEAKMGLLSKLFGVPEEKKYFDKGINSYKLGNYEESSKAFEQAIRLNPNFIEAYALLAAAYGLLGKYEESIKASKEAIRLKPDLLPAYNSLGGAYLQLHLYKEAIETYKHALVLKPDFIEAYVGLGAAYASQGLYRDSLDVAEQAIRFRPDYADAYRTLGVAYDGLGRHQEAIHSFEEAIRLNPTDFAAQAFLQYSKMKKEI